MDETHEMKDLYGIGAVVSRTGLTAPNIRMWEKRYGVVTPRRSDSNRRLYSGEDVERLTLLKRLTDCGDAISTIANLKIEELRKRVADALPSEVERKRRNAGATSRILLIGPGLEGLVRGQAILEVDVVDQIEDIEIAADKKKLNATDLLVIGTETLFPETIVKVRDVVERSKARRAILVYRFTSSKTASALANAIEGLLLLKGPIDNSRLRRECLVQLNAVRDPKAVGRKGDTGPIPERIYDLDQLDRISRVSSTVECECPQHMAGLLQSLSAFEKYSEECEDRNPEDALLHGYLHRTTAQARRSMEEALRHLVMVEGIDI